mgnify:CR=1 FL=1
MKSCLFYSAKLGKRVESISSGDQESKEYRVGICLDAMYWISLLLALSIRVTVSLDGSFEAFRFGVAF